MAHPPALLPLGKPFIELQSVDSTNNYARSLVNKALAGHGTAVFAHVQMKGRGQRGKQWDSQPGANLILSLVIEPKMAELKEPFCLSACIALAAREFFSGYAGEYVKIKWPNDIYWKDRKAGGILVENIMLANSREWKWAIAGIGININQTEFPSGLPNPVSLKQVTGKDHDPVSLSKELCEKINIYLETLKKKGFSWILEKYNDQLYKKSQGIKLKKGNRVFEAALKGVSKEGKLIVSNGIEEEFSYEEIEWVK